MEKLYRDRLRRRLLLNVISFISQNKTDEYIRGYEQCLKDVVKYLEEAELYVNNSID
jgi:hypothetical protein